MPRTDRFKPEFVETMPDDLDPGKLYISIRYRTASHLCACGCGRKVVTPIKPHRWRLTYDGECVSLSPSIGRWQLPCRAHYYIRDNHVRWARAFTEAEMASVLRRDARDHERYYESRETSAPAVQLPPAQPPETKSPSAWRALIRRLRR